jgi:hypothetical protein
MGTRWALASSRFLIRRRPHKERPTLIRTRHVQAPTKGSGDTAIALVRVVTSAFDT